MNLVLHEQQHRKLHLNTFHSRAVHISSWTLEALILQTDLHTFPYKICWENSIKNQIIFSLMKIVSLLIIFSLHNALLWSSIIIRTKRFNEGKGEKTIFSSDFCPFERLGVDHCCFKSILCWSHCLVSLAHTQNALVELRRRYQWNFMGVQ